MKTVDRNAAFPQVLSEIEREHHYGIQQYAGHSAPFRRALENYYGTRSVSNGESTVGRQLVSQVPARTTASRLARWSLGCGANTRGRSAAVSIPPGAPTHGWRHGAQTAVQVHRGARIVARSLQPHPHGASTCSARHICST